MIVCAWAGQVAWQHWGGNFHTGEHFFSTTLYINLFCVVREPLPSRKLDRYNHNGSAEKDTSTKFLTLAQCERAKEIEWRGHIFLARCEMLRHLAAASAAKKSRRASKLNNIKSYGTR